MSDLRGKRALVTGSTSGIGLGIARQLAGCGCSLMLHGLPAPAGAEPARSHLASQCGVEVRYHQADLREPREIDALISATRDQLGGIDILINNAGVQYTASLIDFPVRQWDDILAVNLSAAFHTTRLALPAMQNQQWGRIINIASVHGLVASVNKAAYVASKHGLVGLTKVTALEMASQGVTCNAICPGWTRTPLIEPQIESLAEELGVDLAEGARQLLAAKQPSEQFVTVEQIGQLVVFLCSEAANQVTGAALPVDGGWTAQ